MRLFTLSILHSSFITRIYAFFVSLPLFFHYNYCTNSSYIIYMLIIRSKMTPLRIGPRMSYSKMYSVCDNFLLWNQYRDIEWKCLYQLNYYFQGWHMSFLGLYTYKLSHTLWVFLVKKNLDMQKGYFPCSSFMHLYIVSYDIQNSFLWLLPDAKHKN